jgi:adenine-specific DNA-methyltransferase
VTGFDGRLELTWTNKHLRLLAHEGGRYEWVPPADYRVAEVRLLDDVSLVGEVKRVRAGDNLLIHGDALNALRSLARLPEFAREYLAKVKLAYLDPPFNTQQSFLQYDDALELAAHVPAGQVTPHVCHRATLPSAEEPRAGR